MLDWCLQWVPQIQQGFQIKSYGMIFITRLAYLAVLLGKELGSPYQVPSMIIPLQLPSMHTYDLKF